MAVVKHAKLIVKKPFKVLFSKARLSATTMGKGWTTMKIIPEVIDEVPPSKVNVWYPEMVINEGTIVKPKHVKVAPRLAWKIEKGSIYTMCMTGPDAPSARKPTLREWHHWLVGNIPENKIDEGEVLSEYIGAGPPKATGMHRYVFLIYKQPAKITFEEKRLTSKTGEGRGKFNMRKFAEKYKLGSPIAGNFFQAEFDDTVPQLLKDLGLIADVE